MNRSPLHPLCGARPSIWFRLWFRNGVNQRYLPSALQITLISLLRSLVSWRDPLLSGRKIREHRIGKPPIFIIGIWRSGTTFLHNILSQDPQFCFPTLKDVCLPNDMLYASPISDSVIRYLIPNTRGIDSVEIDLDSPQEEEMALAALGVLSSYLSLYFPKTCRKPERTNSLSKPELKKWMHTYRYFLNKVSLKNCGRRLLLKNPANIDRIREILKMFPDACFICIRRNTERVIASMEHSHPKMNALWTLQKVPEVTNLERTQAIGSLVELEEKYQLDRFLIPDGHLAEVVFEELTAEPLKVIESIYRTLDLDNFDSLLPQFRIYLESVRNYRQNTYNFDEEPLKSLLAYYRELKGRSATI